VAVITLWGSDLQVVSAEPLVVPGLEEPEPEAKTKEAESRAPQPAEHAAKR
jgi:hypothetical protein